MGVTSALALENAIDEAIEKGRQVFLVGIGGQTEKRLRKLGVMEKVPPQNLISDRVSALRQAVNHVDAHPLQSAQLDSLDEDTLSSQAFSS